MKATGSVEWEVLDSSRRQCILTPSSLREFLAKSNVMSLYSLDLASANFHLFQEGIAEGPRLDYEKLLSKVAVTLDSMYCYAR